MIATDHSSSSRSLQISRYGLLLFLLFEILAVGLGVYGFMVLSNLDERAKELSSLRKYSYYLTEVLNNSEFKSSVPDTLVSTNPLIKQIGSKNQVEYYNSMLDELINNPNDHEPVENFINFLEIYQENGELIWVGKTSLFSFFFVSSVKPVIECCEINPSLYAL